MHETIRRFVTDACGVTTIEYGLIAILVGVAFVATVFSLGNSVNDLFYLVSTAV